MTLSEAAHLRLHNQLIAGPKPAAPEEVVRRLGAIQAQDYHQALWAIGLRTAQATVADVERAIADGRILRTWPMRGTIHFVPPEDARWMLKLSASRMIAADGRRQEQLELDDRILERCGRLVQDALRGGRRLARPEMMRLLEDAGVRTESGRGYHILWYASQTGLICIGPMLGKQQTFVLLEEWAPRSRELTREESLAELAGRYVVGHGPATAHDFAWWAGLTVADARAGLETARPGLVRELIEGRDYWLAAAAPSERGCEASEVYLLPGFDEYLLGYRDRDAVLAREHAPRIVPGGNGVFRPVIVAAGRVVGTWKARLTKRSMDITINPFADPGAWEGRADVAARRYSDFVGAPLSSAKVVASP